MKRSSASAAVAWVSFETLPAGALTQNLDWTSVEPVIVALDTSADNPQSRAPNICRRLTLHEILRRWTLACRLLNAIATALSATFVESAHRT